MVQMLSKFLTVFSQDNSGDGSAEDLHTILFQHTALEELDATIESRLSTEGKQDAIGTLFGNDFLDKKRSDGQEVDLVSELPGSLNSSDIRIDQNSVDTFF